MSERSGLSAFLLATLVLGGVNLAMGQPQAAGGRASDPPGVEVRLADRLVAVEVVALPDPRVQRVAAQRASARRRAAAEAVRRLQRFIDASLARHAVDIQRHSALHRVISDRARVEVQEPLVDHGVRLVMVISFDVLHDAAQLRGVPWSP